MRLAQEVERRTFGCKKRLKVAVMGCVVNGPGEAKDCDIGIAGGKGACALFARGEVLRTVPAERAEEEFLAELDKRLKEE